MNERESARRMASGQYPWLFPACMYPEKASRVNWKIRGGQVAAHVTLSWPEPGRTELATHAETSAAPVR